MFFSTFIFSQYSPSANLDGSNAIFADSSIIISWADSCIVERGFVDISDTNFTYNENNRASYGEALFATQKADNYTVSLGDGGSAILYFETPIVNGIGNDFVVFENALTQDFLELAFVEVSSDGINFYRFPSHSLTQNQVQISSFGSLNTEKIHNLAGKYEAFYGTPFNLDDLDVSANLNLDSICYVKVVDVIGNINMPYANFDIDSNIINDPWPTPFNTCGFDLDAVGVINNKNSLGINNTENVISIKIFPNPATNIFTIDVENKIINNVEIYSSYGKIVLAKNIKSQNNVQINVSDFVKGLYFVKVSSENFVKTEILIVN